MNHKNEINFNEQNYEECKGCRGCDGECILKPNYIDKQGDKLECPCQTCLVKGICVKPCVELQEYYHSNLSDKLMKVTKCIIEMKQTSKNIRNVKDAEQQTNVLQNHTILMSKVIK